METGKTGKYFKYAIGEIVLVVIGILIALQINNWNEDRKLRTVEHAILQNIKSNLIDSKSKLDRVVNRDEEQIKHYKRILHYIDQDLPYNIELDSSFIYISTWASPYLTYIDYETLKTKGLDIIQNDSIKNGITYIYESAFAWLVDDFDRLEWARAENVTIPFSEKHIRYNIENNLARPNDFEALKTNDEFINILNNNMYFRKNGIEACKRINKEIEEVIQMIDKELKQHD
ncbi:DUF6090 family protein [Bizionia arctica]|nr:DUF6090 family protein [Bizionia arctica]